MSRDPADKNQPSDRAPSSLEGPTSLQPASTDDIDGAWASNEGPRSSERPIPGSERPSAPSRPPAVRVSSSSAAGLSGGVARRRTLLGVAPAPETSHGSADTPSSRPASLPPPSSPDAGASKFEAAAQLLEQKLASQAPKPPVAEVSDGATAKSIRAESAEAATPLTAEVSPESSGARHSERGSAAPKSRRPSSAPPPPRSIGMLPMGLAAAVFVVMFLAGAVRELRDAEPSRASAPTIVAGAPAGRPGASPAPLPMTPPSVALPEPQTAGAAAQEPRAAEPIASASAEPVATGETIRVLMRSAAEGAKFYRQGKQVGMNSIIVELTPGEERAFKVELSGRVPQTVVIDGSQAEVVVLLPRIPKAPATPTHAGLAPPSMDERAPAAPLAESVP